MMRRSDIAVGLSILVGVVVVFFGVVWLKGGSLMKDEMPLRARFREVGQLQIGNTVKLRGVPIGQVEMIELEDDGQGVIVTMSVKNDVRLPQDAVVLLSPESMFGDWQAEIFPRERFTRYDYAMPRDPGVLPGYSLPDISQLTAVADRIAENLSTLSDRFQIAFTEETAIQLRDAIENIQQLSSQLTSMVQSQEKTLDEVADNLNAATETMSAAAASVKRVADQVDRAVEGGELSTIVDNVNSASAQLDSLSRSMVGVSTRVNRTLGRADTAFAGLSEITRMVSSGQGTLGRLLQDTTLYGELVQSNAELQALLEDFRKNPRRYINLKIF